jgi:hypothetical protein
MLTRNGLLAGMTAGLIAAGVMSAVRLLAHRAGLIDRMIPQVVQERVAGEAGLDSPGGTAGHQLAAEVIHHAASLGAGGLLGVATAKPGTATGVVYGLAIWVVDAVGLLPALRVQRVGGLGVDAAAHAVFGATLAFAMRELAAQPRLRPLPTSVPVLRRVG